MRAPRFESARRLSNGFLSRLPATSGWEWPRRLVDDGATGQAARVSASVVSPSETDVAPRTARPAALVGFVSARTATEPSSFAPDAASVYSPAISSGVVLPSALRFTTLGETLPAMPCHAPLTR